MYVTWAWVTEWSKVLANRSQCLSPLGSNPGQVVDPIVKHLFIEGWWFSSCTVFSILPGGGGVEALERYLKNLYPMSWWTWHTSERSIHMGCKNPIQPINLGNVVHILVYKYKLSVCMEGFPDKTRCCVLDQNCKTLSFWIPDR